MKKSELKALIREVVEEVQNNELNQMAHALENNPEFVDAAMKRYGNRLNEEDISRKDFIEKLAKILVGAGVAVGAISSARGGPMADMLKQADKAVEKSNAEVAQKAKELGITPSQATKGSTLDIVRQFRNGPVFKKYRDKFAKSLDSASGNEYEQIRANIMKDAARLLKTANDFDKEKRNIVGNILGMVRPIASMDDVRAFVRENPELVK